MTKIIVDSLEFHRYQQQRRQLHRGRTWDYNSHGSRGRERAEIVDCQDYLRKTSQEQFKYRCGKLSVIIAGILPNLVRLSTSIQVMCHGRTLQHESVGFCVTVCVSPLGSRRTLCIDTLPDSAAGQPTSSCVF